MGFIDIDGETYELPKMTLAIEDAFAEATRPGKDRKRQVADTLSLMLDLLPHDYVAARVGGDTAASVDVVALAVLAEEVWDAYRAPIDDHRSAKASEIMDEMKPILDQLTTAAAMMEKQQKGASRQGFSRVV